MSSLMFYCLKVLISAIFEKRVTDGRMDGRTDRVIYRVTRTRLKTFLIVRLHKKKEKNS